MAYRFQIVFTWFVVTNTILRITGNLLETDGKVRLHYQNNDDFSSGIKLSSMMKKLEIYAKSSLNRCQNYVKSQKSNNYWTFPIVSVLKTTRLPVKTPAVYK